MNKQADENLILQTLNHGTMHNTDTVQNTLSACNGRITCR